MDQIILTWKKIKENIIGSKSKNQSPLGCEELFKTHYLMGRYVYLEEKGAISIGIKGKERKKGKGEGTLGLERVVNKDEGVRRIRVRMERQ